MKKFNLTHSVLVIFIFTCSTIFSQTDSVLTYYPDDISIDYSDQSMKTINMETGKTTMVPVLIQVKNIKKIQFLSDSLISISNDQKSDMKLNINKINGIDIKSGTNLGIGISIGAVAGLLFGLVSGAAIGSTFNTGSSGLGQLGTAFGVAIGSGIGIIAGGVVGGIIGSNSPTYKTYDMNKFKFDKKKELERILKIEKRNKLKVDS